MAAGSVQNIKVTGGEAAAQQVERVADSEKLLGDETDKAGTKAKGGAQEFGLFGDVLGNAQRAAMGFVGGFVGLQGVLQLTQELKATFEQIVELQEKMATADGVSARKGVRPVSISYSTTPAVYRSVQWSMPSSPRACSGLMYSGVPSTEAGSVTRVCPETMRASPKSATLMRTED